MSVEFLVLFVFGAIIALSVLAVVVILIVAVRKAGARGAADFHRLADGLGATVDKGRFGAMAMRGSSEGLAYGVRYSPGGKNTPPSLTVMCPRTFPFRMTVRREGPFDRFSKNIGLAREIQTGDPLFDQSFYVETDDAASVQNYLGDAKIREALRAILEGELKVSSVACAAGGISVVISPISLSDVQVERMRAVLSFLRTMTVAMPEMPDTDIRRILQAAGPQGPAVFAPYVLLFVCIGSLHLIGAVALIAGLNLYRPLTHGFVHSHLPYSLPALALFLYGLFQWIRGRSSSHRVFLVAAILSVSGFLLAGAGLAVFGNGRLDDGQPVLRVVTVTQTYYTTHKNSRTYYVAFPSWRNEGEQDDLAVTAAFYRSVRRGDRIRLETMPGHFGDEWLASFGKAAPGE